MESGTKIQSQDIVAERTMIEAEGLVKTYGKGVKAVRALDGITFTAAPGPSSRCSVPTGPASRPR